MTQLSPTAMTRRELVAELGVSYDTLRYWEREGLVAPSGRRGRGRTAAVVYEPADLPQVAVVAALRQFAVEPEKIRPLLASCQNLGVEPGWSGWLVVHPSSVLRADRQSLEQIVTARNQPALVVRVAFPEDVEVRFPTLTQASDAA